MPVDRDAITSKLAASMDAILAARREARIADAEREMRLRDRFSDFWESVEVLNQQALERHDGRLQFAGESWDAAAGVISGALELRGPGGEHQIAYRAENDTLQVEWPDGAERYATAALQDAVDRLIEVVAAVLARPD